MCCTAHASRETAPAQRACELAHIRATRRPLGGRRRAPLPLCVESDRCLLAKPPAPRRAARRRRPTHARGRGGARRCSLSSHTVLGRAARAAPRGAPTLWRMLRLPPPPVGMRQLWRWPAAVVCQPIDACEPVAVVLVGRRCDPSKNPSPRGQAVARQQRRARANPRSDPRIFSQRVVAPSRGATVAWGDRCAAKPNRILASVGSRQRRGGGLRVAQNKRERERTGHTLIKTQALGAVRERRGEARKRGLRALRTRCG